MALLIVVLVVFACNGDGQGPSTSTPGDSTPGSTPGSTPTEETSAPGETPSPEPQLPEGLLQEFPQYPGAELVSAEEMDNKLRAEFRTADSREEVVDFYSSAMSEAPWKLVIVLDLDENTTGVIFGLAEDPDINGTVAIGLLSEGSDETAIVVEISLSLIVPTPEGTPTPTADGG